MRLITKIFLSCFFLSYFRIFVFAYIYQLYKSKHENEKNNIYIHLFYIRGS